VNGGVEAPLSGRTAFVAGASGGQAASPPKVGVATRLAYGVGSVAFGVKDNGFTFFLLLFYNQVLGLPAAWVGAALMVALVVDGMADPLVGQLSDHWRSRLGRRHPFMYAAALPAAIGYALLWNPPRGLSAVELFAWLACVTIAVRLAVAAYEVPSAALVAELSESYDQRTALLGYRTFLAWCGGLMMTIVSYQVFLVPNAQYPSGQLNPDGYARMGIFGGVVIVGAILVSARGTHRFIPFLKPPPAHRPASPRENVAEIAAALSNRSLLMLLGAGLASALAIGVGSALNIYLTTFFWGLSTAQISILASGLFGGAVIAFITTSPLSRRFDKKTCAFAAAFVYLAASLAPIVLRLAGTFPANGAPALLPLLVLSYLFSTAAMVASMILTTSMLADVVEDNEVRTGRRNEGVVFSANLFIQKCVSGVGVFAAGLLLTLTRFPEHARPGPVDPAVVSTLGFAFGGTQLLCYGLSIVFLLGYRITRGGHEANLATLRRRQAR
jgi:Na+/melibiose symporter-like transporter